MLMKSRRLLGTPLSILGTAGLAAVLLLLANPGASESRYIDLRRIEPIHGDVAAGARKAAVCHACHGVGAPVAPTCARDSSLPGMPRRRCEGNLDRHRSIRGLPRAARAVLDVSRGTADELS
jgi:hypothetical protein